MQVQRYGEGGRPGSRPRIPERELVEQLKRGDREALGAAYERYGARVYAFALRRLRQRADAEDVVQDVFVEASRSIRSFEGRSRLSTWILGIASHEVAGRLRYRARHAYSPEGVANLGAGGFAVALGVGGLGLDGAGAGGGRRAGAGRRAAGELPSAEAPPDRAFEAARTLARCHEVLEREVPPAQREVFELHARHGGDVASIARTLGRTPQAVKISLFRTRRRLAERVAGLEEFFAL